MSKWPLRQDPTWVGWAVAAVVAVACTGCYTPTTPEAMAGSYYINPDKNLRTVGRVVLVELESQSDHSNVSTDATEALYLALQKKHLFGLTVVKQDDPRWPDLRFHLEKDYRLERHAAVRQTLNCDHVLIGTVTQYQPYPRLSVGLRLRLVDLTDGSLLWGVEQVWDSTESSIEGRIKNYYRDMRRASTTDLEEKIAVVSPLRFLQFVAYEVGETLQPGE